MGFENPILYYEYLPKAVDVIQTIYEHSFYKPLEIAILQIAQSIYEISRAG